MKSSRTKFKDKFVRGCATALAWVLYAGVLFISFKYNFWEMYSDRLKDVHLTYGEALVFVMVCNLVSFNAKQFLEEDEEV